MYYEACKILKCTYTFICVCSILIETGKNFENSVAYRKTESQNFSPMFFSSDYYVYNRMTSILKDFHWIILIRRWLPHVHKWHQQRPNLPTDLNKSRLTLVATNEMATFENGNKIATLCKIGISLHHKQLLQVLLVVTCDDFEFWQIFT